MGVGLLIPNRLLAKEDPLLPPELLSASGLETLLLTWAADPLTTMRIQWIVAGDQTPSPILVSFQMKGEGEKKTIASVPRRFGGATHWAHRIDLTGLNPGTLYQFQVGENPEKFFFETAPATLEKTLTFAEGGDIGTDPKQVEPLHRMAAAWDPLFGLVVGDHSYSNGKDINAEIKYFKLWHANMVTPANRLIPMVAGIGNHEVIGGFHKKPEDAPYFYSLFEGLFKGEGAYGALDFGSYLSIILLDSGHTCEVESQADWLRKTLEARKSVPHCFVGYHVPAYPSVRKFEDEIPTQIRTHWLPILEASKVRTVFEHHDHAFKRTKALKGGIEDPKGITFIGDGAWGRTPRKVHPMERTPYFEKSISALNVWKVELTPTQQHFSGMNEKGEVMDSFKQRAPS